MEEIELKPCPFCGSTNLRLSQEQAWIAVGLHAQECFAHRVQCDGCRSRGSIDWYKDKAIAAWNTRAAQAEPANQ